MSFNFTTTGLEETPVTIDEKPYILREGKAPVHAKYDGAKARAMGMRNGAIGINESIGELDILIVSLCLFEVYTEKDQFKTRPVSRAFVEGLPGRVVDALAREARRLCRMDGIETLPDLEKRIDDLMTRANAMRAAKAATELEAEAKN